MQHTLTSLRLKAIWTGLFFFFALVNVVWGQQASLSVQGVLTKSDGTAVDDGNYSITFKLWTAPTGGTVVHNETISNVETVGGVYSVVLGINGIVITAPFDEIYYLGVSVGGGAELTPRPRLTHAPYALAIKGSSNIFPGSGTVTGDAFRTLGGAPTSTTGGKGYSFGAGGDTDGGLFSTADGQIALYTDATKQFEISSGVSNFFTPLILSNGSLLVNSGNITGTNSVITGRRFVAQTGDPALGQVGYTFGTSLATQGGMYYDGTNLSLYANNIEKIKLEPDLIRLQSPTVYCNGFISVDGFAPFGNTTYGYLNANGQVGPFNATGQTYSYSISAYHRIKAAEFNAYSDRRIKKDIQPSDKSSDLATLLRLRVTNYRHVDEISNGAAAKKGFIAQEVEEVFPEAVSQTADFIPNIYEKSVSVRQFADQKLQITLSKNHELKTGDCVRLVVEAGKRDLFVSDIINEHSFVVDDWKDEDVPSAIFVLGKKVDDFRQVDYDRIHTLNVSATQELARKVELLENENAALRQKNNAFELQLADLARRIALMENGSTANVRK